MREKKQKKWADKANGQTKLRVLWQDWILWDLVLGFLLVVLVFLVAVFVYGLRFPKLRITSNLLQNVALICLLLPFPIGVFGLAARQSARQLQSRIFRLVSFPALAAAVASAVFLLFLPPFCSSTSKLQHYLQFDALDAARTAELKGLFPEILPSSGKEINYQYFRYKSVLEETVHVTIGVSMDEETYQAEQKRILELKELAGAAVSQTSDITLMDSVLDDGVELHVTMDDNYRRIIYTAGYQTLR